jgi:Beta-lactamase
MFRCWLASLLSLLLWSDVVLASQPHATNSVGCTTPGFEPFDAAMMRLIQEWNLPGGSLAVSHNGRILLVRGYGLANKSTGARVTPATKFRLGSMSKPVTAVAILKLAEEGRLGLDDKVLPLLGDMGPAPDEVTYYDYPEAQKVRAMPGVAEASVRKMLSRPNIAGRIPPNPNFMALDSPFVTLAEMPKIGGTPASSQASTASPCAPPADIVGCRHSIRAHVIARRSSAMWTPPFGRRQRTLAGGRLHPRAVRFTIQREPGEAAQPALSRLRHSRP